MWETLKYALRGLLTSLLFIPACFSIGGLIWIFIEGHSSLIALRYVLPVLFVIFSIPVYLLWRKAIIQKQVKPFAIGFAPLVLFVCWHVVESVRVPAPLVDPPFWAKDSAKEESFCKISVDPSIDLGMEKTTSGNVAGVEFSRESGGELKIFYTYSIEGKEYKSATILSKGLLRAKEIVELHPKGSSIEVKYNPENPLMNCVLRELDLDELPADALFDWHDQFVLPEEIGKDKQSQLASCIMEKLNLSEFKKEIHTVFPEFSDERIQAISIGPVDGSMVTDYYKNRIEIWITIPSSKAEFRKRHPSMNFIISRLNQEMNACIKTGY